MRIALVSILLYASLPACFSQNVLDSLLSKSSFDYVIDNYSDYKFEIIVTEIYEDSSQIEFTQRRFGSFDDYYYPASTVKLPLALALAYYLDTLPITSDAQFENTRVCDCYDYPEKLNINQALKRMLVYSSNPEYNYLFEVLGAKRISDYFDTYNLEGQVTRRLLICDKKYWRKHNPSVIGLKTFENEKFTKSFRSPVKAKVGKEHYYGDSYKAKPRNFRKHNYLPLSTNHNALQNLIFYPNSIGINASFRDSLLNYLMSSPRDLGDTSKHDNYTKYLYCGSDTADLDKNILIINNVGRAYGFMTDHAYIADTVNNKQILISARIYVNENNILGDDNYQYDEIALPFFRELGIRALEFCTPSKYMRINQYKKAATQE